MEWMKFTMDQQSVYYNPDKEWTDYFVKMKFKELELKYENNEFLYLKDVLIDFGMYDDARKVPIYLGWDKSRGHKFEYRYTYEYLNFSIVIGLNPYDISKEYMTPCGCT